MPDSRQPHSALFLPSAFFLGSFFLRAFFGRDFRALFAGFGQADSDCLFAAFHLLAAAAALELAPLLFVHCLLNRLTCFLTVLGHDLASGGKNTTQTCGRCKLSAVMIGSKPIVVIVR